jgi:hypothetical protein
MGVKLRIVKAVRGPAVSVTACSGTDRIRRYKGSERKGGGMARRRKRWLAVIGVLAVIGIVAVFFTATAIAGLSVPHWIYVRAPIDPPVTHSLISEVYTTNVDYIKPVWIPSAAYRYRDVVSWKQEDPPGKPLITLPLTHYAVYLPANLTMDFKWSGSGANFGGSFRYDDARMKVYASGAVLKLLGQKILWHYPPYNAPKYPSGYAVFTGSYKSTPPPSMMGPVVPKPVINSGTFLLFVEEREPDILGTPGPSFFWISFYGGPYNGYENGGVVKGDSRTKFLLNPILDAAAQ